MNNYTITDYTKERAKEYNGEEESYTFFFAI